MSTSSSTSSITTTSADTDAIPPTAAAGNTAIQLRVSGSKVSEEYRIGCGTFENVRVQVSVHVRNVCTYMCVYTYMYTYMCTCLKGGRRGRRGRREVTHTHTASAHLMTHRISPHTYSVGWHWHMRCSCLQLVHYMSHRDDGRANRGWCHFQTPLGLTPAA